MDISRVPMLSLYFVMTSPIKGCYVFLKFDGMLPIAFLARLLVQTTGNC